MVRAETELYPSSDSDLFRAGQVISFPFLFHCGCDVPICQPPCRVKPLKCDSLAGRGTMNWARLEQT